MRMLAVSEDQRGRTSGGGLCWCRSAFRSTKWRRPNPGGTVRRQSDDGHRQVLDVVERVEVVAQLATVEALNGPLAASTVGTEA